MARDFNGSTDRIDYSNIFDPANSAISVACWIYPDSIDSATAEGYTLCIHDSGDTVFRFLQIINDNSNDGSLRILREWSTGSMNEERYGTGALVADAWQHIIVTSDANADAAGAAQYIDGAVPGSTTSNDGSGSQDACDGTWSIGARAYDDNRNVDGRLAEMGVWDRVITADEIAALAKGFSPLHFLRGLRAYIPLIGRKDVCRVSGATPTYDGSAVIPHPRIIYPG